LTIAAVIVAIVENPLACQGDGGAALAASPPSAASNYIWRLVAGMLRPTR